jgi:hypothetical protein
VRFQLNMDDGVLQTDVLRLGNKWRMSAIGDAHGNDGWLRLFNVDNTGYFGGFAADVMWCTKGSLPGSDLRLKENIHPLENATAALRLLRGVHFDWRSGGQSVGLIAQEVEAVLPDAVAEGPDGWKGINPRRHRPAGRGREGAAAMIDELRAAPAHPEETHHGRPPRPYVKRTAGDIIRADDWNEAQVRAREDIAAHDHTGGLGAPHAPGRHPRTRPSTAASIDPDSRYTVKDLTVAALKVTGTAQLAEIRAALASFSGAEAHHQRRRGRRHRNAHRPARGEHPERPRLGRQQIESAHRLARHPLLPRRETFVVASGNGLPVLAHRRNRHRHRALPDTNGNLGIGTAAGRPARRGRRPAGLRQLPQRHQPAGDFGMPLKSGFYQNGGAELTGDVPDGTHPGTHF